MPYDQPCPGDVQEPRVGVADRVAEGGQDVALVVDACSSDRSNEGSTFEAASVDNAVCVEFGDCHRGPGERG